MTNPNTKEIIKLENILLSINEKLTANIPDEQRGEDQHDRHVHGHKTLKEIFPEVV